ncbi:Hsp33 family molecular chaperone HslO [Listeria fleischmannii]|jgi:molecular chaperone Hsp33|uniref:33 kDa chaperonin n=2 Tax=Listeria fleischmannii TaxID=1069827 RepID=W7DGZ5_9LIST|nr:Hsp33 family molecular chaperone HslO [Listeria fleischmannii]EUJ48832.1 Hsp33-like chaperonin [Listeria fleischmannii FSL S10-1203]MBC1398960.1 Hsp33 family molecular chaperone HslO [Listeria fleischmannii]MBC1419681.1 Hsp33 family molecular chaperone HslO [Listeria fleischmannii]MBC1427213.1 Hsp33 family molecular chaperone HslO [Listeria fleischmannii]STY34703.1 Heat shock protein 33 homolog [Listeria fleischmannii subsp. coloradonensis]
MKDYLVKALAYDGRVRIYAAVTTDTVSEGQKRHDTWPVASAALGRTMTATLFLGAMQKENQKITAKIEGNGPIGTIIADSDTQGAIRGYVTNPHVNFVELNEVGKLDVRRGVGTEGTLSVVKDLGFGENFTGQIPIVSGEIAEDFTYYLANSEQINSSVGVGVLVNPDATIKAAGGFMLQLLPGADDALITEIEKNLAKCPTVSRMIDSGETPESIIALLAGGKDNVKFLETIPVKFECNCSKERFKTAIISLGKEEIRAMIDEEHGAKTECHFCRNQYHFSEEELESLYEEAK